MTTRSANNVWLNNISNIIQDGSCANPRGIGSKELISYSSTICMSAPVVAITERKLSYQFMAAEALWIMEGNNKVDALAKYAPSIIKYSDNGVDFYGAYGPQLIPQLEYVLSKLTEDQDTRQAVATIWIRNPQKSLDIPCTVSAQWLVREGKIHCIDTMRSSDLWLGWPYDVFNFSILTTWIGLLLRERGVNLGLGQITIQAGSQHLYDQNIGAAERCLANAKYLDYEPLSLEKFDSPSHLIDTLHKIRTKSKSNDYWLSELA